MSMTESEAKEWFKGFYNGDCERENFEDTICADCNFPCRHGMPILRAISALEEIQQYRAIGTVEELRELKENRDCKNCAGCTVWKCDCANTADKAIEDFANFIHEKAKECNGLRLSGETRSWTHANIFDYVNEFKKNSILIGAKERSDSMETSVMINQLRRTAKKHENDTLHTFDTNISAMCTDVANRLEELEKEKTEIRAKAIEEFAKAAKEKCKEKMDVFGFGSLEVYEINKIAERLKGE